MNTNIIVFGLVGWNIIVTVFLVWLILSLKNLLKEAKDKNFLKVLRSIEEVQKLNTQEISLLGKDLSNFKNDSLQHIQKVGLVKYNPFSETGGDHSFSLALLDGKKNGIIITSLHSRERTRVYLKDVEKGKSKIELSKEEGKALSICLK